MSKELTKPSWYNDDFYNKTRTAEEWLFELWKRYQFKQDKTGLPNSIYTLPKKQQEKYFIEFIFDQQIDKYLGLLEATPPQPIKYPSVGDIFIMYHQLINSAWYKNNPNRDSFESAVSSIINEEPLSRNQKTAFLEMYKTPWCVFNKNHTQNSWCPKKEMEYLSGIPISLDPGYSKEDTVTILKKKLKTWVGKLQDIQRQFARWQESKILAVFDLRIWFKIQGIEITNIGIHKLIWQKGRTSSLTGEEVNPDDDIKHSIDLTNRVIDRNVLSSLIDLCEARKFKRESKTS